MGWLGGDHELVASWGGMGEEIVKEIAYMNLGKETHLLFLAARNATQTVLAPLLESGTATETCVRHQ